MVLTGIVAAALREVGFLGDMVRRLELEVTETISPDGKPHSHVETKMYASERGMLNGMAPYPDEIPPPEPGGPDL